MLHFDWEWGINLRCPREIRDSLQKLKNLPVITASGGQISLSELGCVP
ncbi:hypothetical protein [Symbiopectobacterium purcellii]